MEILQFLHGQLRRWVRRGTHAERYQHLLHIQAQLLAFTRVFLRNPGVVVLDEASSRLDPATETLLERAVDHLLEDRTAILIAHRLATVTRADDIIILEDGRVVEAGARISLTGDPDSVFSRLLAAGMEEALA